MKTSLVITVFLLLVALTLGSFRLTASAEDVSANSAAVSGSFAGAVPMIPGYNAPYPFSVAGQGEDGVPAASMDPAASIRLGSFAAAAPAIPGYNADYPVLSMFAAQN